MDARSLRLRREKIYQGDGTAGGDVTVTSTTLNWTGTMTALGGEGGQAGSAGGAGAQPPAAPQTRRAATERISTAATRPTARRADRPVSQVCGSGGGPGTFDFENSTQSPGRLWRPRLDRIHLDVKHNGASSFDPRRTVDLRMVSDVGRQSTSSLRPHR